MAGTIVQNLWDRCYPLSGMSERKNVHDRADASPPMSQPLAVQINPMNPETTNCPASCKKDIPFRNAFLLPKSMILRSSRPSLDLFLKIWASVPTLYPYKWANSALNSSTCR